MTAAGQQVVALITAQVHRGLQVQTAQSGNGIYRWLGSYTGADGKTACVELGQVIAANGHLQLMWGDTSAELAPANVPILAYSLDSAAQAGGVTPPLAFTVAGMVQQMSAQLPATLLQGETPTGSQAAGTSGSASSAQSPIAETETDSFVNTSLMSLSTNDFINDQEVQEQDFLQSEGYETNLPLDDY
jgi:hypothetical protein